MNSKLDIRSGLLVVLILVAAFSRLVPHMPNFSPLGAIALFGAASFSRKWQAFLIPLAATWLSDLVLNNVVYAQYFPKLTWFYPGFYWQYGTYLLIAVFGYLVLKKITPVNVLFAAIGSSLIFFVLSNFGVWLGSTFYSQDLKGIAACYLAGLPFLKGTLLGTLFYSGVLFGGFALLQFRFPILRASGFNA